MQQWPSNRVARAALAGLLLAACKENLVDDVSTDVCASGKRWIGGLTPSEEMYPGHDCVGCHLDNGGPELMLGGTIYGVPDPEGARTTLRDCFGVEGVQVTVTAADGQVLQTRTNRAGNFYFEGRAAALAKPFQVSVEYTSPAAVTTREPMNTRPSYGGCARCHNPQEAEPTPGAEPGAPLGPDEVVADVYPIYTGPVAKE
jgi:mono/diheme cytochrome c family protein